MISPVKPLPREDLEHVLTNTRALWEEARGQSFFITGGTGFFGMWLLESFAFINDALSLGATAVSLTRNKNLFFQKAPHLAARKDLQFIEGDIRSFSFPPGRFPYIIHAATEAGTSLHQDDPEEMLDAIVSGTRRLLDFAAQTSARKLLFTSSGAVYGKQPADITHLTEDYLGAPNPLLPGSAYGEGKRLAEHMSAVHSQKNGYELKVARCFAFVGPHLPLDGHFAIGNFIRDALKGGPIHIAGDGTPLRSYLYASDLAVWLWTLLFRGKAGSAYNVGSDQAISIGDLAERVKAAFNPTTPVIIAKKPSANEKPMRYVPNIAKAKHELELTVQIALINGIKKTIYWNSPSIKENIQPL